MADQGEDINSKSVTADILCEFLEVAFHLILYMREVYPAIVFERRKKYNVPVQMCCHPELNSYIQDVLQTVKPLVEKEEVQKISLVISDKGYHPIERFTFELGHNMQSLLSEDNFLLHIESALRGFLLKISVCDALLNPNPPDCTFSVLVFTRESAQLQLGEHHSSQDFPWITADQDHVTMDDPTIIPLKSMTSSLIQMQLYVEESRNFKTGY